MHRPTDEPSSRRETDFGVSSGLLPALRWGAIYTVVILAGIAYVFGWSNLVWEGGFMSSVRGATVGDHVQLTYYLWLWWDAITTWSHLPWLDAYQFAGTGHLTHQPFGWPLVLVSLPVHAVFGPVAAFNAVFYSAFIAAAGSTYAWVRKVGVPVAGAAVAGIVFAFAPFRLAQRWHINSLLAFLLPLTLYFIECALRGSDKRSRLAGWAAAASLISLAASGEMHLVTYFVPTAIVYAVVRSRGVDRQRLRKLVRPALVGLLGVIALGVTIVGLVHNPSERASQDMAGVAANYAPRLANLITSDHVGERTAYPGLVTGLLAIVGIWVLRKRAELRRFLWFMLVLLVGAYVLALIPAAGGIGIRLYEWMPVISEIRVPGRILILAVLALSALAGFGASRLLSGRRPAMLIVGAVLIAALIWDSSSLTRFNPSARVDPYLLEGVEEGASVMDMPTYGSTDAMGSRYMFQIISNPGPRVGGYSVFATTPANVDQRLTSQLPHTPIKDCEWAEAASENTFKYVAVHQVLFSDYPSPADAQYGRPPVWLGSGRELVRSLDGHPAFARVSATEDVVVYRFDSSKLRCEETRSGGE